MNRKNTEESLIKNIFHLANRVQAKGDTISSELTIKQWFLLSSLYKEVSTDASINNIAKNMAYTRQSTKKLVYNLEKEGYVDVKKSTKDKRSVSVIPTEKSHLFFKNHNDLLAELADELFNDIDDQELLITYNVLLKMRNNITEMEG
ncbi:MAG: MarR family winged helix-turn-helix transcriptional regulator [Coprobacillaceae bacterium]